MSNTKDVVHFKLSTLSDVEVGGIAAGQGLSWNGSKFVPATLGGAGGTYALPIASASLLGGVKVGANLAIDANGVLSASTGGASGAFTVGDYVDTTSSFTQQSNIPGTVGATWAKQNGSTPKAISFRTDNGGTGWTSLYINSSLSLTGAKELASSVKQWYVDYQNNQSGFSDIDLGTAIIPPNAWMIFTVNRPEAVFESTVSGVGTTTGKTIVSVSAPTYSSNCAGCMSIDWVVVTFSDATSLTVLVPGSYSCCQG